jgi:hypothetical protein
VGDRRASAGCAHARVRSHVDTAQLLPSPGLFVLSFDEFQMGTATRTRFGRRHSVGNKSPPAQHRYDFLAEHATHFRPVDVVCQGSNVVWSLPFSPLVRELPVRLTTKIRQPPARIDLDPVATPPALDRLRPAGPVQSVVQPPLLIPGHGHSRIIHEIMEPSSCPAASGRALRRSAVQVAPQPSLWCRRSNAVLTVSCRMRAMEEARPADVPGQCPSRCSTAAGRGRRI